MNTNEKENIHKKRDYIVSKSNEFVQKSRYELSVTEQRAVAYICSMIKPAKLKSETWKLEYEFNILEYAKICGLKFDSGRIYEETKSLLKGLIQKVIWLKLDDGSETTVNWISKVWTNKKSGIARIRIDEDMAPYLFGLQEKFVSYGLINILAMKSQFSIRLYEILKSYTFQKTKIFDIEELKNRLMVDDIKSYNRYPDFRRKVIDIAIREINEYTDIFVSYEALTKGRKVIKIKFKIEKKDVMESYFTYEKVTCILDKAENTKE